MQDEWKNLCVFYSEELINLKSAGCHAGDTKSIAFIYFLVFIWVSWDLRAKFNTRKKHELFAVFFGGDVQLKQQQQQQKWNKSIRNHVSVQLSMCV